MVTMATVVEATPIVIVITQQVIIQIGRLRLGIEMNYKMPIKTNIPSATVIDQI